MPFEPIIGNSFGDIAAQRAGYASLNANIESQNANRAVAAQDAVNRWLAQASELRQRAMDQDAYRSDAAQQNQIAQVMSERKFSFDAAQEAARLAEERRRTDQMAKKADAQLQQNRDIIAAQEKQQTLKSAQDIQDYGSTFAAKYPGSKRTADETEAAFRKLESEQEALTAEKEALQAHPTQSHFFKGNTLSPESTDRIAEINKLLRENAKELGDRGKIARAWDAASKSHTKLVDQMTGYGFIPDDANGFILHGGSQQKFPFNTGTQPVQAAPVNAGQGGPIAAMSAATMTGTTPQPMPAPLVAPRVTPPAPAIAAPMPAPVTGTAPQPTRQWKWDAQSGAIMPTNAPAAPPQRPVMPLAPTNAPVVAPPPTTNVGYPYNELSEDQLKHIARGARLHQVLSTPPPQAPIIAPPPTTNAPAIVNRKYGSRGYNVTPEDFERQRANDFTKLSGMSDTALQKLSDTLGLGYQRYQPGRFSKKTKGGFLGGETFTDIGRKALEQMIQAEAERKDLNI